MSLSSTILQYSATDQNIVPRRSTQPVTTVPLHRLCANCHGFFQQWTTLDQLQHKSAVMCATSSNLLLCQIAHLVAYEASCHCCHLLWASLQGSPIYESAYAANSGIYLQRQTKDDERDQVIRIKVAEKVPVEETETTLFISLILKSFHHTDVGGFNQHITAKSVPRLAQDNIDRARVWLRTCLSGHDKCSAFHNNTVRNDDRRPTRVLEVSDTSVKLRCNLTNESFEYLALSHMWGDPSVEHLQLKLSNINAFEKAVPWYRLSSVYKEAIRVTLALGYNYIWIDSLCIIQDSKSDWEYEAALMATVYGNAACNLTFIFPSISPSTPTRSDPRAWNPCVIRPATPSHPGLYIQHHTSLLRATYQTKEPQDWLVQRHWPLFSRAWTFQEYLLSPRTLLLGHRNLMWQCSAGFYDELLGPIAEAPRTYNDVTPKHGRDMGKARYFPEYLTRDFGKDLLMSSTTSLSFILDWQALITEYRGRNLSFGKDRVIAFAGVAKAFQNIGGLTYLAGAWEEFFPLCLLWYVHKKSEATVRRMGVSVRRGGTVEYPIKVREDVEQKVPSWSQFSVPLYTHHQTYFMFNDDEVFVRHKSIGDAPRVYWDDIYWTTLDSFRFGDNAVGQVPKNGYFDFTGLQATLSLPILPAEVSWPADLEKHFDRIRAADTRDAGLQWSPAFTYYSDVPSETSKSMSPPIHSVLALVAEFQICRTAGCPIQRRLAGLVLVRGEEVETWKRVGAWKLRIKISNVEVSEENMREVAERWKEYTTWEFGETWTNAKFTLI